MKKGFIAMLLVLATIPFSVSAFTWWNPATWFSKEKVEITLEEEIIKTEEISAESETATSTVEVSEVVEVESDVGFLKSLIIELQKKNDSFASELKKLQLSLESVKKTSQVDKKCAESRTAYKTTTDKLFDIQEKKLKDIRNVKKGQMATNEGRAAVIEAFDDYYDEMISPLEFETKRLSRDIDIYCP